MTCSGCGGMIISRQELRPYFLLMIDADNLPMPPAQVGERTGPAFGQELICPECSGPMVEFNYCYDSNQMLNRCQACDLLWVDGWELEPLAGFIKGNPAHDRIEEKLAKFNRMGLLHDDMNPEDDDNAAALGLLGMAVPALGLFGRWHRMGFAIPVGDSVERKYMPISTVGLIAVSVLFGIGQLVEPDFLKAVITNMAADPVKIRSGYALHGLVSSLFLHASIPSFVFSMVYLWLMGDNVEDRTGHATFVFFYLLTGMLGNLVQVLATSSTAPIVGSGCAVAAVMGAYIVFWPEATIATYTHRGTREVWVGWYLIAWALLLCATWLFRSARYAADPPWFAHIAGFALGAAWALIYRKRHPEES